MRRVLMAILGLMAVFALAVAGHFAAIEVGREVVTLRTVGPDGSSQETRLWIVDDGDVAWLHSGGTGWASRFEGHPIVELHRAGVTHPYTATAVPGPHPRVHGLMRAKYGWSDRWVRFIGPDNHTTLAVRLDLATAAPDS